MARIVELVVVVNGLLGIAAFLVGRGAARRFILKVKGKDKPAP